GPHGVPRGVHRLPRRRGDRHRVRRRRHRHQRPAAVTDAGPVARAAELAALGHHPPITTADLDLLGRGLDDEDARVRAAALGALARAAPDAAVDAWARARNDPAAAVRRRAAELAPALASRVDVDGLLELLDDPDVTVVEAAPWAIDELGERARSPPAVAPFARTGG